MIRIIEGSAIGLGPLNLKIQKYYAKSSEEHPRVADKTFKLVGRTFVPYFFLFIQVFYTNARWLQTSYIFTVKLRKTAYH